MRSVLALGLVVVSACASAEPPDEGAPPTAETEGATNGPAAPPIPGDAWRAGAVEGQAPILLSSFEAASEACNEWAESGADAIRSIPPRSGDYACRLCAAPGSTSIAIARDVGPLSPGRYTMTAWVRARPNALAPASVSATLASAQAAAAPGDAYAPIEVTIDLTSTATVRARIAAPATEGECILVDDIAIRRE